MIPSEIWTLIGVVVGAILGFGLTLLREHIKEREQKRKYLRDLLADLGYNKILADKDEKWGYHTLGYSDAKGAKYLFDLPDKLRTQIYDAHTLIFSIYKRNKELSSEEMEKLKELVKDIIPTFKKHIEKMDC